MDNHADHPAPSPGDISFNNESKDDLAQGIAGVLFVTEAFTEINAGPSYA